MGSRRHEVRDCVGVIGTCEGGEMWFVIVWVLMGRSGRHEIRDLCVLSLCYKHLCLFEPLVFFLFYIFFGWGPRLRRGRIPVEHGESVHSCVRPRPLGASSRSGPIHIFLYCLSIFHVFQCEHDIFFSVAMSFDKNFECLSMVVANYWKNEI